ncbi:MAG: signal peptidase II [Sulfurovum sp.]|nr:signal peptidase II [Sulfurovum sp.]
MRVFAIFFLVLLGVFIIDQNIKVLFVDGYYRAGECIDLVLYYNKGVAFSMFASLGEYLKWIQSVLIIVILYVIFKERYIKEYPFALGLILGGALGNLYDRFIYEGVVDYVAWHCGFNFAVFNLADVAIDIGAVWLLIGVYFFSDKEEKDKNDDSTPKT